MAFTVPVEIADIIIGNVEDDKPTLLNLLLTSHAFQRIAELRLYASISFLISFPRSPNDADLVATARSFLHGIASGNGGRARYVKEIHLPDSAFRGEQYSFQRILKSVANLADLRIYKSSWHTDPLNLRTFFEDSPWQSSPPPFVLKALLWYGSRKLEQAGFEWFLTSQKSLEHLVTPDFPDST